MSTWEALQSVNVRSWQKILPVGSSLFFVFRGFFLPRKAFLFRGKWRASIFFGSDRPALWEANKHKAKLRMAASTVCPCLPVGCCCRRLCWHSSGWVREWGWQWDSSIPYVMPKQEGLKQNMMCGRGHWCGCFHSVSSSRFGVSSVLLKTSRLLCIGVSGRGMHSQIWMGLSKLLYKAEREDCD